ncbi:MAG: Fe-S cluster assembly protein SufD [Planctomycetota bacterium]|nr:Fe-S cluster assembly protein SufD [Planctomycetaceae bacterium]MDQ3329520.1 Fe-S cluster assembly protein SufD [Planctomycetota bacterium]
MTLTATPLPVTFDEAAFEAFLATRDEPAWVTERRQQAFSTLQDKFEVELDPEEWRRVNLRLLRPQEFSIRSAAGDAAGFDTNLQHAAEFGGRVIHSDGRTQAADLADELRSSGVVFGELNELVKSHRELVERHLFSAVSPETDRFSAWHAAFWTGGTALFVPRGLKVEQPLHSLIGLASAGAADLSHTLIVLEDGASAALLEETASATDEAGFHLGAVELILGQGANLRYVQLQNWNDKTFHIAHQTGRVAADAHLQWTVGGLGAKLAHIHQDVILDGRSSTAEVNGVTFAVGRQQLSYYTQQNHNAPDTRSDLLYKTVLRDRANVVWRGMIRVEKEATRTDGYQRCDSLMLSDHARSDSIPGLEIETDDVRCTHGATTGRVDAEQIFYCRSRGLTEFEAMHMIVEGFFHQIYDRIPVQAVRDVLGAAVEKKLGIG